MMPLELSARNTPATLRSTGTTIAAAAFKDYVVFGADSRATAGSFIASSNCLKLHRVTDEIYICGSGVSADLIHLTHKVSRQAEHQKALFGKILVENVVKPLSNTLFNYMGALNVGLLVGGFDRCGAQLYTVSGNGYNTRLPFAAEGSGSTFALPFLHKNYEYDLPEDQGIKVVSDAIRAGISNDLYSGFQINIIVMKRVNKKIFLQELMPYEVIGQENQISLPQSSLVQDFKVQKSSAVDVPHEIIFEIQNKVKQMEVS